MFYQKLQYLALLIPFIFGVTTLLEKFVSGEAKEKFHKWLFNSNRESYTKYVAGTALNVFHKFFHSYPISKRFFLRSFIYTIIVSGLLLLFLYIYYPHIFYNAMSYPINNYNISWGIYSMLVVALVFLTVDLIANIQTKYFLEIMYKSGNLTKFIAIGYADLVVTISFAILASILAISLFIIVNFGVEHSTTFSLDFTEMKYLQKAYGKDKVIEIPITLQLSDREKLRHQLDRSVVNQYPDLSLNSFIKSIEICDEKNESICIKLLNKDNIPVTYVSREFISIGVFDFNERLGNRINNKNEKYLFCERFSHSALVKESWFTVKNWNEKEIYTACIKNGKTKFLTVNFKWKYDALNFSKFISVIVSNISNLTASPLHGDFPYFSTSVSGFYDQVHSSELHTGIFKPYYYASKKGPESATRLILLESWKNDYSDGTYIHANGMPWSTFYMVTILTSSFIWIVIILSSLLYPTIWFVEKINILSNLKYLDTKKLPFTFLGLIFSFWAITFVFISSIINS